MVVVMVVVEEEEEEQEEKEEEEEDQISTPRGPAPAGIVALTSVRCSLAEVDTTLLNGTVARRDRGESPAGT